jgi:putative oxidoreductase
MTVSLPAPARDLALLIARIGLGVVFIAHGWQKLVTNGVDGTAGFFASVGVPLPTVSAWLATLVELVGGGLLVLGLAVPVAGLLLAVDMIGAWLFVHRGSGVFVADGGWELVLALGVGSLVLAAVGAGRYSIDHLLGSRTRRTTPANA